MRHIDSNATRAADALRVAKRAMERGQESAAKSFLQQSIKLNPTDEAHALMERAVALVAAYSRGISLAFR